MADAATSAVTEIRHDESGQLVINWWLSCIWGAVGGLVFVAWVVHWIQVLGMPRGLVKSLYLQITVYWLN